MQPIQLPALRPSQVYQGSPLTTGGPPAPLHTGSLPRFLGSSSPPSYSTFDTPHTTTGYASYYLPPCNNSNAGSGRTTNGVPSSSSIIATPSALRSMATGTPISVTDVPPSLTSFKTITGSIHAPPPCEWTCDTVPFLPELHYDYYPLDKSASGSTASSPSLQTHPSTSFCPDPFDPSSAMSYPQLLNSGAPTSFPGMMTLPGSPSQFASADTTQSLRSARANPSAREITTRMTTTTTASTTRATKSETHTRAREKRHGCWMCEKSFDRPSTLRKHLLVHTGVKAFVCETCGRRFGVASNLNRHIKRCVLKPVNLASRTGPSNNVDGHSSNGSSISSAGTSVPESSTSPAPSQPIKRTREPEATEASEASAHSSTTPPSATDSAPKPPTKRRRRAPSPSQWVPQSLAHHNILPFEYKGTPVPLPPVSPTRDTLNNEWIEERNSWDDDTTPSPYHPYGWKGILPGPGLASGVKDGSDDGLVNGGTYVMGRLVMV